MERPSFSKKLLVQHRHSSATFLDFALLSDAAAAHPSRSNGSKSPETASHPGRSPPGAWTHPSTEFGQDNLSLQNLTLLFSYLYVFGLCSSDLIYDFLIMLGKRLTEVDVSTVVTVLECCGEKLRGDDPAEMKNLISSVQSKAKELKASPENDIMSKRMEFMLETIRDVKNNKMKSKEVTPQHSQIKKWLQKLSVGDKSIRGLTWRKLVDPSKKGQWWLYGEVASTIKEVAGTIDMEITETKHMLHLAASQRMNTKTRKAIFCVVMGGDDYMDAFEKLLRLDLPGKQFFVSNYVVRGRKPLANKFKVAKKALNNVQGVLM